MKGVRAISLLAKLLPVFAFGHRHMGTECCLKALITLGTLLFGSLALKADTIAYALTDNPAFGTINLATGNFTKIADVPSTLQYLANGPNHNLLSESFDGNLVSINPANGAVSVIGPTGFGDCSGSAIANLGNCQLSFGQALGKYYATDFNNNLFTLDPLTGHATLIGKTGIPAVTTPVAIFGPDGSFDFYDENLFEAGGQLYANFDTGHFDPNSGPSPTSPAALYVINAATGAATKVADTDFGQVTIANIDGVIYGFNGATGSFGTLDVTTGQTKLLGNYDPNIGLVSGASAVPEPGSLKLLCCCLGIATAALWKSSKLRSKRETIRNSLCSSRWCSASASALCQTHSGKK